MATKRGTRFEAVVLAGYITRDVKDDELVVWDRAVRETHDHWRPKLRDDFK